MENLKSYCRSLSIAGSDNSGGAGIQADLKTFSALGSYGMSAITAVVDENTQGVYGIHPLPVEMVEGQIRSCLDDIGADSIKIGMMHSSELILRVADTLACYPIRNIVLDPVMVATSGDPLLKANSIESLISKLIPMARVITPNIPEAEIILGKKIVKQSDLPDLAKELSDRCGGVSVLLKAGHLSESELIDIFFNAEGGNILKLKSKRMNTVNTHGTGCTLSSAFAALLSRGEDLDSAAQGAKEYIVRAIETGAEYCIGKGHGPVHHFHLWW